MTFPLVVAFMLGFSTPIGFLFGWVAWVPEHSITEFCKGFMIGFLSSYLVICMIALLLFGFWSLPWSDLEWVRRPW